MAKHKPQEPGSVRLVSSRLVSGDLRRTFRQFLRDNFVLWVIQQRHGSPQPPAIGRSCNQQSGCQQPAAGISPGGKSTVYEV